MKSVVRSLLLVTLWSWVFILLLNLAFFFIYKVEQEKHKQRVMKILYGHQPGDGNGSNRR